MFPMLLPPLPSQHSWASPLLWVSSNGGGMVDRKGDGEEGTRVNGGERREGREEGKRRGWMTSFV